MKRKEFKQLTRDALEAKGVQVDEKALESAMGKVARHAKAKYGDIDYWQYEHEEGGVYNGVFFYEEYGAVRTFNRDRYQSNRG